MAQLNYSKPIVGGTNEDVRDLNTSLSEIQASVNTVSDTQLATGIDGAKLSAGTVPASALSVEARVALPPSGTIIAFAGIVLPDGWLWCRGEEVGRTEYADLFSALGTTYGVGNGVNTFNLPDSQGRGLVGAGSNAETVMGKNDELAEASRTPVHIHDVGTYEVERHDHWIDSPRTFTDYGDTVNITVKGEAGGLSVKPAAHTHGMPARLSNETQPSFTGSSNSVTSPYVVTNHLIKT